MSKILSKKTPSPRASLTTLMASTLLSSSLGVAMAPPRRGTFQEIGTPAQVELRNKIAAFDSQGVLDTKESLRAFYEGLSKDLSIMDENVQKLEALMGWLKRDENRVLLRNLAAKAIVHGGGNPVVSLREAQAAVEDSAQQLTDEERKALLNWETRRDLILADLNSALRKVNTKVEWLRDWQTTRRIHDLEIRKEIDKAHQKNSWKAFANTLFSLESSFEFAFIPLDEVHPVLPSPTTILILKIEVERTHHKIAQDLEILSSWSSDIAQ